MKGHSQKQFYAEKNIIKKALKQLVQKKHEIRIHFLNNTTCQVQKLDLNEYENADMASLEPPPSGKKHNDNDIEISVSKGEVIDSKLPHSLNCKEDLFQVIYRSRSRMESIGWHEDTPIKRTSNMSRTFRRRRKSNLQDYQTINENQDDTDQSRFMKNSQLTVNNLELSGFTNAKILKQLSKTISPISTLRNERQNQKNTKLLGFFRQKNFKRVQLNLPFEQQPKGIFAIATNKLNKRWKYSANMKEGSRSSRLIVNPEILQANLKLTQKMQNTHKNGYSAQKAVQSHQHHEHPFLKKIKPSSHTTEIKKTPQRRACSQFIRSRPKYIQHYQSQKVEEGCRPWSVFRNVDEKIDQVQQPKLTLQGQTNE